MFNILETGGLELNASGLYVLLEEILALIQITNCKIKVGL
jgi:hypothetical protein